MPLCSVKWLGGWWLLTTTATDDGKRKCNDGDEQRLID